MECVRNNMDEHPHNAKQQRNTSAHKNSNTTHSQIKG